ncbi:FtsK/SpoIIIE domain-containing protein [Streptomyces sp. NPDC050844]|uniref:FtsK/SpoIIIE domain-containing protein n=1 Tax=Streptomyces sp. NPDC050844 TaxID=3155790 RepID=UPI0033F0C79A
MTWLTVLVLLVVAFALILRWRRPAWYWMTFGVTFATCRVLNRYRTAMEACRLVVSHTPAKVVTAALLQKPLPPARPATIRRIRPTRTGLVLRLKLRPGQDAESFTIAADRLRHAFTMHSVTARELGPSVVELQMTGFDVLKRIQMPTIASASLLRVPVALIDDGGVYYRDYRAVPHSLILGATQSGKSVMQRCLVTELAPQPVALVGIDCKGGVQLAPLARRFSALADNADDAADMLDALVARMPAIYDLIRHEQRISADTTDEEITDDIWGLPEYLRPVPIVVLVDEVAELLLYANTAEKRRRERIVTALIRLVQLGRAAGIYVEICGQRFGAELGDGVTMLRAQLTGRIAHRVNDESSAKMAFADISPEAVWAATQITNDRPGTAIVGDSTGGWSKVRTPHISLRRAVNVCNRYADVTPDLHELAPFRPVFAFASTDPTHAPASPVAELPDAV